MTMTTEMCDGTYHQRVKEEKRQAAVQAATDLFLEQGYERTSLQQVAKRAEVSTATLFKRYPTKAALLEAIVEEFWEVRDTREEEVPFGNPRVILKGLGTAYAQRLRAPEMIAIYRLIIAETPRFPGLGKMLFDKGEGHFVDWLKGYLNAEIKAGVLAVPDVPAASRNFFATIAGQVFWPELVLPGSGGTDADVEAVIDQTVTAMLALYTRADR
ncbi:TetR/AcrR family transcriptional regulator [Paraburkholderia agricolaris]|uniref:TetR/AcrR family transcriptional regulator n=1 Tax=Paraburkholderia agricolaris TaxID=2152888 RepID=UPI001FE9043A|nr:TetR/AcrR family transcriptional regulator [Paraburkholderia agricolaris]